MIGLTGRAEGSRRIWPQDAGIFSRMQNERLCAAYLSPAWGPTNTVFDDVVKDFFERALSADSELDVKWQRGIVSRRVSL